MKDKKNPKLKIFIISGEASGDVLGAKIIRSFLRRNRFSRPHHVEFRGIGGMNMKNAGLKKSLFPIEDLSVMGFTAVLMRARTLLRRIRETVAAINEWRPDIVLTIDSPGFAKAVASRLHGCESRPKLFHFVAPQVWAWRPGRAKKFAKLFDRLYCFFDFEVPYFTRYGLPTIPVGHPVADGEIKEAMPGIFRKRYHIARGRKIVAMMPGSRMNEIENLLPLMKSVADKWSGHQIVIPGADTVRKKIKAMTHDWKNKPLVIMPKDRYILFRDANVAVAASGTVTVELAILHTPAVVVYKTNFLTYLLYKLLIRVKYISLVNIISGKEIYPELLQHKAAPDNVFRAADDLIKHKKSRTKMVEQLKAEDKIWSRGGHPASDLIKNDILKTIRNKK
ncbi:MAG: lipid-A-disaccharide synthase [Alphaproteobacteria bacterium]|nr:lipid-A-disaccharide synthase [Alphaproteobacteria bacterium]